MPEALTQTVAAKKPQKARVRTAREGRFGCSRGILFFVADFVFLVLAAITATMAMHMIHQLEWPFIPTSMLGMVAAMLVQTVMAFAAAPLLGSIETMIPSMIVAMISPMTICALHLFGCESTWTMAALTGLAFAIGTFVFIQLYALSCKRLRG